MHLNPADWIERMVDAGLTRQEATYYVGSYPAEEWPDIIKWAQEPADLDSYPDGPIPDYDY